MRENKQTPPRSQSRIILRVEDLVAECHILDTGQTVITGREMSKLFTGNRNPRSFHGYLERLKKRTSIDVNPIYCSLIGGRAKCFNLHDVAMIAKSYVGAFIDGRLRKDQECLAKNSFKIFSYLTRLDTDIPIHGQANRMLIDDVSGIYTAPIERKMKRKFKKEATASIRKFKRKKEFVYIIKDMENQRVKIGMSANPKNRLKTLQTACSSKLQIVHFSPVGNAKEVESILHEKYTAMREVGEWFSLSDVQIKEAISSIQAQLQMDMFYEAS